MHYAKSCKQDCLHWGGGGAGGGGGQERHQPSNQPFFLCQIRKLKFLLVNNMLDFRLFID